jgi:transcriptional/translational regulatory protein YebC/TACO1
MFTKRGHLVIEKNGVNEEMLMAAVIDAGADDFLDELESWEIVTEPEAYETVLDAVRALSVEPVSAQLAMLPQNYLKLEGAAARQILKLMELLDDHDDVQRVWSNFDIEAEEIEASLA